MNPSQIADYIVSTLPGAHATEADGTIFFFYDPAHLLAFATIKTTDDPYDTASGLDRPDVYSLNVGVRRATFDAFFQGKPPASPTALDQPFPHPVYGAMSWIRVLNPSKETFEQFKQLLAEAYELDVERFKIKTVKG